MSAETHKGEIDRALVQEELQRILSSRHFQTSRRGKEFLRYVVDQKINGFGDLLKERSIGVQLFGRKPDYPTGEDPVVRVQAGDVRHRLERYYAEPDLHSGVVIRIPLGSYVPVFSLKIGAQVHEIPATENHKLVLAEGNTPSATKSPSETVGERIAHDQGMDIRTTSSSIDEAFNRGGAASSPVLHRPLDASATLKPRHVLERFGEHRVSGLVLAGLIVAACLFAWHFRRERQSVQRSFWAPASSSSRPVLLCLPKPMVYRPSDQLFERYEREHPNVSLSREARQDEFLPFASTDKLEWGDMIPVLNSGPGIGGVVAAINVSKVLTEQGMRFELRFGEEATYAEMRDSPVVIIGGINTKWAPQLTSEATFAFDESVGAPNIYETAGERRVWRLEHNGPHITKDYGLITRQLSGKSGQFLVEVAGISHFGTEAASEMLTNQQELSEALRSRSVSFKERNLQIVVSTDITNERSGPPHVVAVSSW